MIVGVNPTSFDLVGQPGEIERMIAAENDSGASVCQFGLGGGTQEKFIVRHRARMHNVRP